jgi:hypothetical protein
VESYYLLSAGFQFGRGNMILMLNCTFKNGKNGIFCYVYFNTHIYTQLHASVSILTIKSISLGAGRLPITLQFPFLER